MRRLFALSLLLTSGLCIPVRGQQAASTPATDNTDKPRVYITDSNSWSVQGSAGGANGVFAASSTGGAQPQTAENIKPDAVPPHSGAKE